MTAPPKPAKRGPKPRKPIKRGKRPNAVRATDRGREKASLNALFSRYILARDPLCVVGQCGDYPLYKPARSTDAAHLFPKSIYPRIRYDKRNAVGACRACHEWGHKYPQSWQVFALTRLGSETYAALILANRTGAKIGYAEVREALEKT